MTHDRRRSRAGTRLFSTSRWSKRRLRILQGLFYGLSCLDCWATVQGRETRTISIRVGHQHVWIALERIVQRHRSFDEKEVERLKFSIRKGYDSNDDRISWVDTEEQSLKCNSIRSPLKSSWSGRCNTASI